MLINVIMAHALQFHVLIGNKIEINYFIMGDHVLKLKLLEVMSMLFNLISIRFWDCVYWEFCIFQRQIESNQII